MQNTFHDIRLQMRTSTSTKNHQAWNFLYIGTVKEKCCYTPNDALLYLLPSLCYTKWAPFETLCTHAHMTATKQEIQGE